MYFLSQKVDFHCELSLLESTITSCDILRGTAFFLFDPRGTLDHTPQIADRLPGWRPLPHLVVGCGPLNPTGEGRFNMVQAPKMWKRLGRREGHVTQVFDIYENEKFEWLSGRFWVWKGTNMVFGCCSCVWGCIVLLLLMGRFGHIMAGIRQKCSIGKILPWTTGYTGSKRPFTLVNQEW